MLIVTGGPQRTSGCGHQAPHVFEEDGSERTDMEPVDEVLPEHYTDEAGWWTCDPRTKMHDLAVIYRSTGAAGPDRYPVLGPKDLRYVCIALSDAFPLADDPLAGEFSDHYGCRYVVVARFEPPISIGELRSDPITREWPALKAGFVRAAMAMPNEIWDRLVEITGIHRTHPRRGRCTARLTEGEQHHLERRLEDWLEQHPQQLRRIGHDVVAYQRQMICHPDHDGTIDLLYKYADRPDSFLAVELKAGEIKRDAVAQVLGYVGWLRNQPGVSNASALIIGLDPHLQVPWVLATLPDGLVQIANWDALDLPDGLARAISLRR
jgi:hypothetical protein